MNPRGDPQAWHSGCETDRARNEFIVPQIVTAFELDAVKTAVFVGSATAYIPLRVTQSRPLRKCVLIDMDEERMEFSLGVDVLADEVERISKRFEDTNLAEPLDAVIMSNTLLEFQLTQDFAKKVRSVLKPQGLLLIFVPDVLEDVIDAHLGGDVLALKNFTNGVHKLIKQDKFTAQPYNFYAHRNITIIESFLRIGFVLNGLAVSTTKPKYVMMKLRLAND